MTVFLYNHGTEGHVRDFRKKIVYINSFDCGVQSKTQNSPSACMTYSHTTIVSGGPFMVLEYCEKGILKDFLVSCKENVTVDLEERVFRMIFGICLGMDYLSSRKVNPLTKKSNIYHKK